MSLKYLVLSLSAILIAVFCIACDGETRVTKVDPSKPGTQTGDGVLFSLPQTVVLAEVPLTKVDSKPGAYAKWTPFFYPELSRDDYVSEEGAVFKVGAATFTTRGQTDPDQVYIAHIKAKQFETKTLLLEFNEDGIIARSEASSKDETIDIVTSGIKTVASIVAPLLGGGIPLDTRNINNVISESVMAEKTDCRQKLALARQASDKAEAAEKRVLASDTKANQKAARAARSAADVALADIAVCNEAEFREQLSDENAALYDSLDSNYKKFLRENFGYRFLTYVSTKPIPPGAMGIEFFFTLNEAQQDFINKQARGTSPCELAPATSTNCLATTVKVALLKAKAAYDKIQELRRKREDFLSETTQAQINTSTNLEFRLKELDAQIKATEQTFFFGTSSETTASARFEFKPGDGLGANPETQNLFTYSKGGGKPGICKVDPERAGVFKALSPPSLKGACHEDGFGFESGDLRNSQQLVSRLKTHAANDSVSRFLFTNLSAGTKADLASATDQDKPQVRQKLLKALMAEMSSVINGAGIYGDALFANVEQSGATLDLRAELKKLQTLPGPLTPEQAARLVAIIPQLNRSLLDDAYADELYRHSVWASHQVVLSIDPSTPGFAKTVDTSKLQQPGKRGFPYRVAAPTFARLLDDRNEKGRGAVRIAQFGPVQTLPSSLGGRRSSYKITYFDSTGAIKVFDMSSDALIQKQNITDLTDAATTLRDSEAARLKRDTDLLELRKKKIEAEKALKDAKAEPAP